MLESTGSNYHFKEFVDKDDNLVRLLYAGKGSLMTLTNMDTDTAISLKAYGFSAQITGFDGKRSRRPSPGTSW